MFDESFKRMAVELSEAKGSVRAAAAELGLEAGRTSKWRASFNKPDFREKVEGLTEEQKRIRQLERKLREVKLDRTAEAARDLKKGGTHAMPGIFSRGERNGSDL